MDEPSDRLERLARLTPREFEVLQLRCEGLSYEEIAETAHITRSTVSFHLGHIYEKLGIDDLPDARRQLELGRFCLVLNRTSPDEFPEGGGERPGPADAEPPSQRALVAVAQDAAMELVTIPSNLPSWPRPPTPVIERRAGTSMSLGLVLGMVAVIALVAGGAGAAITALVLVPRTPVGQPASVPAPSAERSGPVSAPSVPTATLIPAPTVPSASPTIGATARPSATPFPSVTPTVEPVNLAGRVPDDIPGIPLEIGTTVTSVVDDRTKPRDVYAVNLLVGQTVRYVASAVAPAGVGVTAFYPGSRTYETGRRANYSCCPATVNETLTIAATGTYYFAVFPRSGGSRYTFRVTVE